MEVSAVNDVTVTEKHVRLSAAKVIVSIIVVLSVFALGIPLLRAKKKREQKEAESAI